MYINNKGENYLRILSQENMRMLLNGRYLKARQIVKLFSSRYRSEGQGRAIT